MGEIRFWSIWPPKPENGFALWWWVLYRANPLSEKWKPDFWFISSEFQEPDFPNPEFYGRNQILIYLTAETRKRICVVLACFSFQLLSLVFSWKMIFWSPFQLSAQLKVKGRVPYQPIGFQKNENLIFWFTPLKFQKSEIRFSFFWKRIGQIVLSPSTHPQRWTPHRSINAYPTSSRLVV